MQRTSVAMALRRSAAAFRPATTAGMLRYVPAARLPTSSASAAASTYSQMSTGVTTVACQQQQVRFSATKAKTAGGSADGVEDPFSSDLYVRLGLKKGASESEVKTAYHRLAKKYHPDQNHGDDAAADKFRHIKEAKEILSNQLKRKIYDESGKVDDAKDPKRYRVKQRIRMWFPVFIIMLAFLGTSLNKYIVKPALKSENLKVRYIVNWLGMMAAILVFPKVLAAAFLVWAHAGMYRDDMMREITEHILVTGKLIPARRGQKEKVKLELLPEDDAVLTLMKGMRLEVRYSYPDLESSPAVKVDGESCIIKQEVYQTEPDVFSVEVPGHLFKPDKKKLAAIAVDSEKKKENSLEKKIEEARDEKLLTPVTLTLMSQDGKVPVTTRKIPITLIQQ